MNQRTLAIIKPDAVKDGHVGEIISMMEDEGFEIHAMKTVELTKDDAKEFYKVHKDKHFYEANAEFMSSGPCIMMILDGRGVIKRFRKLMGPTDHTTAKSGTIRAAFGTSIRHNAVHGSDSVESARFEIAFFIHLY